MLYLTVTYLANNTLQSWEIHCSSAKVMKNYKRKMVKTHKNMSFLDGFPPSLCLNNGFPKLCKVLLAKHVPVG